MREAWVAAKNFARNNLIYFTQSYPLHCFPISSTFSLRISNAFKRKWMVGNMKFSFLINKQLIHSKPLQMYFVPCRLLSWAKKRQFSWFSPKQNPQLQVWFCSGIKWTIATIRRENMHGYSTKGISRSEIRTVACVLWYRGMNKQICPFIFNNS